MPRFYRSGGSGARAARSSFCICISTRLDSLSPWTTCSPSSSGRPGQRSSRSRTSAPSGGSIGGKYRLIDIPISSCLHSDIRRIFILTQFNSASLNRHIGMSYRMDVFSRGFVEIIAPSRRPRAPTGSRHRDAVRQAAPFQHHEADYY